MKRPAFTAAQASAFRLSRQHLAARSPHPHPGRAARSLPDSVAAVCHDSAGIQAQVMSAAEIAIWTRARETTRERIQAALWTERTIVKTSVMRMTLHLIAAEDFAMHVAALRGVQMAIIQRVFARLKARPADVDRVLTIVMDALSEGPQTQQTLVALARRNAARSSAWLKLAWSAVRPLVAQGLVVYGPPRGSEVTFVRADQWIGRVRPIDEGDARAALIRRFFSAFGPATPRDFAKWTGLASGPAKAALESAGDTVVAVTVDGAPAWANREDIDAIGRSRLDAAAVRLLPGFDTLLLAHATKEHLVDRRHFTRVYRPQAWISPVILRGEQIIAVWFSKVEGRHVSIDVRPFARLDRRTRGDIAAEFDALAGFFGRPCDVRYS